MKDNPQPTSNRMTNRSPRKPLSITSLARAYDLACPRYLAWALDPEGKKAARLEDTAGGRALAKMGISHEEIAVARLVGDETIEIPVYTPHDLREGMRATLELLNQGVPFIAQAAFSTSLVPLPFPIHGLAELLRRVESPTGISYQVIEIKASARVRTSQMLQAMLYHRMLHHVWADGKSSECPAPVLIDRYFEEHSVPVADIDPVMDEFLAVSIPTWLHQGQDVFFRSWKCSSCPFDVLCTEKAHEAKHFSLVAGLNKGVATRINSLGGSCLGDLDEAMSRNIQAAALDLGFLRRLHHQAQALRTGRSIPAQDKSNLPYAPIEMFLDIEPDPTASFPCRLGLLKRDRRQELTAYRGIIMPTDHADAQKHARNYVALLGKQVEKAVRSSNDWLVLYYGAGTGERFAQLAELAAWGEDLVEEILAHSVDIRTLMKRSWHLPIERYGLPEVLHACHLEAPKDETPGFVYHKTWSETTDTESERFKAILLEQGEEYCRLLLGLWDWLGASCG